MRKHAPVLAVFALLLSCGLKGNPPVPKPPSPVSGLRAEGRDGGIRVSWTGKPGAGEDGRVKTFDVLRRVESPPEGKGNERPKWFERIGTQDADAFRRYHFADPKTLEPGVTYTYRVRPIFGPDASTKALRYVGPEQAMEWRVPPGAPTDVVATPLHLSVRLSWKAVEGATSYRVYELDESGKPFPEPAHHGEIDRTNWLAVGLSNGRKVGYVVRAVIIADRQAAALATPTPRLEDDRPTTASGAEVSDAAAQGIAIPPEKIPVALKRAAVGFLGEGPLPGVESGSSAPVSVVVGITDPAPPAKLLKAASIGEGVSLTWKPSAGEQIVGYHVERRVVTSGKPVGEFVRITNQAIVPTTYLDRDAKLGVTYEYQVRPIDAAGTDGRPSVPVTHTFKGG